MRAPSWPGRRSAARRRPCSPATETPSGSSSTTAGPDAVPLVEPDPRQRLAGPRPGIERQPLDPLPRHPAEQLDAPHRPPRRDGEAREDLIAPIDAPQVFDRRDQRHVQRTRRPAARPAGSARPSSADLRRKLAKLDNTEALRSDSSPLRPGWATARQSASLSESRRRQGSLTRWARLVSPVSVELSESFEILGSAAQIARAAREHTHGWHRVGDDPSMTTGNTKMPTLGGWASMERRGHLRSNVGIFDRRGTPPVLTTPSAETP